MENAWLDSLSEDWISQPRSDGSAINTFPSLPSVNGTSERSREHGNPSRIPLSSLRRQSTLADSGNAQLPLSERSLNDINIPASQRAQSRPSKLKQNILVPTQDPGATRTVSTSTTGSIRHHTVQHKSLCLSSKKSKQAQSVPEWKRRLLHGEVEYGEQRDLFSSAGLENIFRPPASQSQASCKVHERFKVDDVVMPSSPPPYEFGIPSQAQSLTAMDVGGERQTNSSKGLGGLKYRMVDRGSPQASEDSLSRSSGLDQNFSALEMRSDDVQQSVLSDGNSEQVEIRAESKINLDATRAVSGQSDIRHEDLSPIFISRHNTVDGAVGYSVLDLPAAELEQRLKNLAINDISQLPQSPEGSSQPLPEIDTIATDDFTHIGKFVNVGRGGESDDGSFQKRMLSPSSLPAVDESGMLCEASVEASTPKNLPIFTTLLPKDALEVLSFDSISPKLPLGPNPSPNKDGVYSSRPGSGSPLKLFGTYDTFTNQKLLRRLSQFENCILEDNGCNNSERSELENPESKSINQTEMNEGFVALSSPPTPSQQFSQGVSRFGDGDLDHFEFSEESLESNREIGGTVGKSGAASPQAGHSQSRFNFLLQPSPTLESGSSNRWRTRRINTTVKEHAVTMRRSLRLNSTKLEATLDLSNQIEILDTPRKRNGDSEGKRLLHSPPKNPTPKRRRTLHKTDISHTAADYQGSELIKKSHERVQSVIGKKRKDARHGDNQETADPHILAMRQILRPRTPTPSQRYIHDHKRSAPLNSNGMNTEKATLERQEKIARVQAELDDTAPSDSSAAHIAGQPMHTDSRKGSVTTQDFLDEAKKIMAGIRGKARPSSGLASVEESELEHDKQLPLSQEVDQDDSYEESTKEPFSRPPSRDGAPLPRLPQMQQDPKVLDHLKKYEEKSDIDGIIASSLKSIGLAKEVINATDDINRLADQSFNRLHSQDLYQGETYQSDPPNVRITEYPELQRKRKHSTSSIPAASANNNEAEFPSQGSNNSSGPSTERSVPTGSSRGSEPKHIIAPHTVSHLIPEQLAGMIFDRERRIWVKQKVLSGQQQRSETPPMEDIEDDPFGDIPDLTVDEAQELSRIKAFAAQKREDAGISELQGYQFRRKDVDQPVPETCNAEALTCPGPSQATRHISRNTVRSSQASGLSHGSNIPSVLPLGLYQKQAPDSLEEVEGEISIHESRMEDKKHPSRRRNATISFSSPLASLIPTDMYGSKSDEDNEEEISDSDSVLIRRSARQRSFPARPFSTQHTGSLKLRLASRNLLARPVSRIDEHDEESVMSHVEADGSNRNISIVISTPLPARMSKDNGSMIPRSSATRCSESILQLTPLPDFSMNQLDESFALEVSYIGHRRRQSSSRNTKRSLSLSIKDLVQSITDIEPYEPFWEHIKRIELPRKRLQTLHMLGKFCSQLEELDVSGNEIGQLDGLPETIRNLRIARNCLSDLSSWGHMTNLQYVDVSNNGLTSLDGFKNLVHLRNLRADDNKIQCLKGITNLDGLISLRLRGNMIETVDFAGSLLQRLTDLDLKDNCISKVHNLQELCSLITLNLEDNDIQSFAEETREVMWTLKYLKLGGNKLEHLDISRFPNIRLLYLDRNCLGRVVGLRKAKHLDSLSVREQKRPFAIDQGFLDDALEVRKLFLSGNLLTTFQPSVQFLNLQYLELANCGLESLPMELGWIAPNLRILNLNFNAIRDIKPLIGIVRLKKLHLAGNRLARLRKTTNVLTQFSTLTKIDLRHNPLTLGFYPPLSEKRIVIQDRAHDDQNILLADPFTLSDGDGEDDAAYAGRLDMETKMRRRVYEMLVLGGCVRLKILDGILVDRASVVTKDNVWEKLVKAELVYESVDDVQQTDIDAAAPEQTAEKWVQKREGIEEEYPQTEPHSDPMLEERWLAEDSFA